MFCFWLLSKCREGLGIRLEEVKEGDKGKNWGIPMFWAFPFDQNLLMALIVLLVLRMLLISFSSHFLFLNL